MSLNWDLTRCEWEPEDFWSDEQKGLTETVIHSTMWLGMGSLTAENIEEFAVRWSMHESMFGKLLIQNGESVAMKPQWLLPYVGLRTNVENESQAKWLSRMIKHFEQDRRRWVTNQLEKEAV